MKRAAKAGNEAETTDVKATTPAAESADDARPDAEVLESLGLPDPESLAPGDDFSAFMAKSVPARLRNRALRRLWLSNPVLANLDGLVDYADDYTDAATVVPNVQTAYQVGKGFVDRIAEMTEDNEAAPAGSGDAQVAADPDIALADVAGPDAAEQAGETEAPPAPSEPQPGPGSPPIRRMKFRLTEE
jgi:hypothetical protein